MSNSLQLADQWDAQSYEHNGWQVIELAPHGNGFADTPGLADGLWSAVDHSAPPKVVLDMQHVSFMSSSLMGVLVQLLKRIAVANGALHVCRLGEHPSAALHACRLQTVVPLFDSVDTAAGYQG